MNQFSRYFLSIFSSCSLALIFLLFLSFCQYSLAAEEQKPINRLKTGFFPGYLASAQQKYFNGKISDCLAALEQVKITPYSKEPGKYFLLKALCSPKEQQPAAAIELINRALKEKGSSSDILYAAALILSEIEANEDALKGYQEAIWFNSFKEFQERDFYFDMGSFQLKLGMWGEAKVSLEKSMSLGENHIELKVMLTQIAIMSGDRRNAILLSRQVDSIKNSPETTELVLMALMVSADPVFHKRDIAEAAVLAKSLKASSIVKAEVGVAAIKALLIVKEDDKAKEIVASCLAANPADPRLQALDQQIQQEETGVKPD